MCCTHIRVSAKNKDSVLHGQQEEEEEVGNNVLIRAVIDFVFGAIRLSLGFRGQCCST